VGKRITRILIFAKKIVGAYRAENAPSGSASAAFVSRRIARNGSFAAIRA
jgi:hypothetical protein